MRCTARGLAVLVFASLLIAGLGWTIWAGRSAQRARDVPDIVAHARQYLRQGRPDLAFQQVHDVRDDEAGAGEAVAVAATALIRMGELRIARVALDRALRLDPSQFEATVTLAELNVDLGNGRRGVELFEAATRLRPGDDRVWMALGKVREDLAELIQAQEAYLNVLRLRPDSREALIGYIRCRPNDVESWIEKALGSHPDDPAILGLAARDAFERGRLEDAIVRAERALARQPDNVEALFARAQARGARSEWELALPDAERASAAWPNDIQMLRFLLVVETRLGMKDRAARTSVRCNEAQARIALWDELAEQIRLNPDDPQPLYRMGITALEGGVRLLAIRCFEAALAVAPDHQPALDRLAELRRQGPSPGEPRSRSATPAGLLATAPK